MYSRKTRSNLFLFQSDFHKGETKIAILTEIIYLKEYYRPQHKAKQMEIVFQQPEFML